MISKKMAIKVQPFGFFRNQICYQLISSIYQMCSLSSFVINNIVTKFIAFLRFRCQIVIFLPILPSLATKSAKNLKLRYYIVLYRAPRARDIRTICQAFFSPILFQSTKQVIKTLTFTKYLGWFEY